MMQNYNYFIYKGIVFASEICKSYENAYILYNYENYDNFISIYKFTMNYEIVMFLYRLQILLFCYYINR